MTKTRSGKSTMPLIPDADNVRLCCAFIGSGKFKPFDVILSKDDYEQRLCIGEPIALKKITKQLAYRCRVKVPFQDLELYKFTDNLEEIRATGKIPLLGRPLLGDRSLRQELGKAEDLPDDGIHLLVRPDADAITSSLEDGQSETEAEDTLSPLPENRRYHLMEQAQARLKAPSFASKSYEHSKTQAAAETAIYDGLRTDQANPIPTIAPPLHIFHPVFQQFARDANNPNASLEPEFLQNVSILMENGAGIKPSASLHENDFNVITRTLLANILGLDITTEPNADGTCPDILGKFILNMARNPAITLSTWVALLGEIKRVLGEGAVDPSVQATNSWRRYVFQNDHRCMRERCCCPVFMIAIAGPWFVILGGVITDRCIVQRLTPMLWFARGCSHDDPRLLEVARVLYALKNGIATLKQYYDELVASQIPALDPKEPHPRNFPYPNSYVAKDGQIRIFRYLRSLEDHPGCVAYLVEIVIDGKPSGEKVVVKFVEKYGEEVHEFLAKEDYAPKLRYYGPLPASVVVDTEKEFPTSSPYGATSPASATQMKMVVMDYVEGCPPTKDRDVDQLVVPKLREIISRLHKAGFVLGDIRAPNVIIDDQRQVKLIDFDWAGRHDKEPFARYPFGLSTSLFGHIQDAKPLNPIRPDHDFAMLDKFWELARL